MAVIRVQKTKNYTVMANYHLRDKNLSFKAKGLMSFMLSLPEEWDYSITGLSMFGTDKIDSVRSALKELEKDLESEKILSDNYDIEADYIITG